MSGAPPFIAIDWGTTNRRVYRIDDGGVVSHTERDGCGVLATHRSGYADAIKGIRDRVGDLPVVCAGMVGGRLGWSDVPYVPVPGTLRDLATHSRAMADRVFIVPGMSRLDPSRADVMRGEEVQFLGAVAADIVPPNALLCQPGTHAKWARVSDGVLTDFTTAMTGEIFALLKERSLISDQLTKAVSNEAAFLAGVEEARRGDVLASLFGIRARALLLPGNGADGASFASGLLIGTDVAARLRDCPHGVVHVLADPMLRELYATAIEAHGLRCVTVDSQAAFAAGVNRVWEHLQ